MQGHLALAVSLAAFVVIGCQGALPTSTPTAQATPTARPSVSASPTETPTAAPTATATPSAAPTTGPTPAPQMLGTITLTPDECAFDPIAETIEPGRVTFDVVNSTDARVGVHFWRIGEGHTFDELAAVVAQAKSDAEAGRQPADHPVWLSGLVEKVLSAGETGSATATRDAGIYAFICGRTFRSVGIAPFAIIGPIEIGQTVAAVPPARGYLKLVDIPGHGVLMFGGFNTSPPAGGHLLSDYWTFDSASGWSRLQGSCDFELCIEGFPAVGRLGAFESTAGSVVLVNDEGKGTFTYDPATSAFEDLRVQGPAAAVGSAIAYDEESQRLILFGGLSFSPMRVTDETWAFDLATKTWTQMHPAVAPGTGNYHQMAYDPESDRMILFGGADPSDVAYDETWAYDYNSDSWTRLDPPTSPRGRYYGDMVYDPVGRRMVLFGGTSNWASATFDDTWVYDPAANEWSQLDAPGPSVRAWHAMAYDGDSGLIILFGGGQRRESYVAETWLFDPRDDTWSEWTSP